jgi:hypothetical protein
VNLSLYHRKIALMKTESIQDSDKLLGANKDFSCGIGSSSLKARARQMGDENRRRV